VKNHQVLIDDLVWGLIGGELHLLDHCIHPVVVVLGHGFRRTRFELVFQNPIKTPTKMGFVIRVLIFVLLGLIHHW
jgi:hypothetical protein